MVNFVAPTHLYHTHGGQPHDRHSLLLLSLCIWYILGFRERSASAYTNTSSWMSNPLSWRASGVGLGSYQVTSLVATFSKYCSRLFLNMLSSLLWRFCPWLYRYLHDDGSGTRGSFCVTVFPCINNGHNKPAIISYLTLQPTGNRSSKTSPRMTPGTWHYPTTQ